MSGLRITFGAFELDPEERLLFREGDRVHLRPQATRALCHLVERRSQIVERKALTNAVWPDAKFVDEQSLNVLIRHIRQALEDDPSNPTYIETIPTRGYRFIAAEPSRFTGFSGRAGKLGSVIAVITAAVVLAFVNIDFADQEPHQARPQTIREIPVAARLAFMQGLELFNMGDSVQSQSYFQNVIALAPDFAEGHLWYGKSHVAVWGAGIDEAVAARPSILQATRLNPELPDAHVELGNIEMITNLDVDAAERYARRALEIDPRHLNARILMIDARLAVGDTTGALRYMEEVDEIDPLRLTSMGTQGWIHFMAGNYDDAMSHCRIAIGISARNYSARNCLYEAYLAMGMQESALGEAVELMRFDGASADELSAMLAYDTDDALRQYLEWRLQKSRERLVGGGDTYAMAIANLRLGHVDEAASNIARVAVERRYPSITFIASDPRLRALADHAESRSSFTLFSR